LPKVASRRPPSPRRDGPRGASGGTFADLAELSRLRDELKEREREQARERARQQAEAARLERERNAFRAAVGDAQPLRPHGRVDPSPEPVPPVAHQFERDESRALAESLSDEIDIDRLLDTDDALSYRQPGIGADVVRRLRRGHWVIQDQIDLHGLRVDEARDAMAAFLAHCLRREVRCIRVVHGKGLGSPSREPVLKGKVLRWLTQHSDVLAFCQAGPTDGGSGALLALLRAPKATARTSPNAAAPAAPPSRRR
jgi:DNA-nicking Smr family endonuclease